MSNSGNNNNSGGRGSSKKEQQGLNQVRIVSRDFIGIVLINFTAFLGFHMASTGLPVYMVTLTSSSTIAGLSTTVVTVAAVLARPFTGIMINRFGRKGILISSLAVMATSLVCYAVFPIAGIILTIRLAHGIGWGLSTTTTNTIAADIIPKKRFAEAMGYFSLTSSISVAIAPAMAIVVLQNGGILPMVIIAATTNTISLLLSIFQNTHQEEKPAVAKKKKLGWQDFFDKRATLPSGVMFLLSCSFSSVVTFIAIHAQALGVDEIYFYFVVYAIVNIFTRPVIGRIIDRTGFFASGILAAIGVIITLVVISFSTNIFMFCVGGAFAGLGMGTGMGTLQTMSVAAVPPERRGVATSTFLVALDAGYGIGAVLAGYIASITGYENMFLIVATLPAIACMIFIFLGKKRINQYTA